MPTQENDTAPFSGVNIIKLSNDLTRVDERTAQIQSQLVGVLDKLEKFDGRFATKEELKGVKDIVDEVRRQIGWAVKIVVGIAITSAVTYGTLKGFPHP